MFFVASKIAWTLLAPANFFVLVMAGLLGLAFYGKGWMKSWGRRGALALMGLALLFLFLPLGSWFLVPLEKATSFSPPDRVDGIILLGGDENPYLSDVWKQSVLGVSSARHLYFIQLARRYPDARLVFTGGMGWLRNKSSHSNEPIVKAALLGLGIPESRLLIEDASRNTYENAFFSRNLVHPKSDENWILVTSAFHMPRALECFRKAGWNVFPAPTDYRTPGSLQWDSHMDVGEQVAAFTTALHEYIGLVAYRMQGRTDALWP